MWVGVSIRWPLYCLDCSTLSRVASSGGGRALWLAPFACPPDSSSSAKESFARLPEFS